MNFLISFWGKIKAIGTQKIGGRLTPPSRTGLMKWSVRPISSIASLEFIWRISAESAFHFCESAGTANFSWWKNSASSTTPAWRHLSVIHLFGPTRSTTRCRTDASAPDNGVPAAVFPVFGKWSSTNWKSRFAFFYVFTRIGTDPFWRWHKFVRFSFFFLFTFWNDY